MPTSANITTAGDIAFTLPVGTWGVRVINESDTLIRRLLGQPAATSGASLGLPLAAGAGETLVFKQPLKQAVAYCAIHAGSGNKTLTYEIITQPTQGGAGPSSSAGSGASNALLLAGASAATLGSLTAATAATGGLLYGTQSGADRKFTLTAAGSSLFEAADAAAQRTLLSCPGLAVANIFSVNGAASTPAALFNGTIFTGGTATTTKPHFLIEPAGTTSAGWNTAGTLLGLNAPSGFTGALWSTQVAGVAIAELFGASGVPTLKMYGYGTNIQIYDSVGGYLRGEFTAGMWIGDKFQVNDGTVGICTVASTYLGLSLSSSSPVNWSSGATFYTGAFDTGLNRGSAGVVKVTNGRSGYGAIDASGFSVSGVAGTNFSGPVSNITVVNGIVTSAS